jgi:hypothetical protein
MTHFQSERRKRRDAKYEDHAERQRAYNKRMAQRLAVWKEKAAFADRQLAALKVLAVVDPEQFGDYDTLNAGQKLERLTSWLEQQAQASASLK